MRPRREGLPGLPGGDVRADDALDIPGQLLGRDLQAAHGAPEPRLVQPDRGQAAAQVDLEAGPLLARVVGGLPGAAGEKGSG